MAFQNGINIPGMLRSYLSSGFSTLNCICELCDNAINVIGIDTIKIYLDSTTNTIIIANNGIGMDSEDLMKAICFYNDHTPSIKHGRFGIGLKAAIANMSQLLSKVSILSKKNEDIIQLDINFPAIIECASLCFQPHDITTKAQEIWNKYSVNNSGTVIYIPCTKTIFKEIQSMYDSTTVNSSLLYQLGNIYQMYLRSGAILIQKDNLEPLNVCRIERMFYDTMINIHKMRCTLHIYQSLQDDEYFVCFKECFNKKKRYGYYTFSKSSAGTFVPKDPKELKCTFIDEVVLTGVYCNDWIETQKDVLNSLNINCSELQHTRKMLGGSVIERNGKIVAHYVEETPSSGDKDRYKYVEDTRWSLSYTHTINIQNGYILDKLFGIEINKTRIDKTQINANLWNTFRKIASQFATCMYKNSKENTIQTVEVSTLDTEGSVSSEEASLIDIEETSIVDTEETSSDVEENNAVPIQFREIPSSGHTSIPSHNRNTPKSRRDIMILIQLMNQHIITNNIDLQKHIAESSTETVPGYSTVYQNLQNALDMLK